MATRFISRSAVLLSMAKMPALVYCASAAQLPKA
jgi:hypothetical protein